MSEARKFLLMAVGLIATVVLIYVGIGILNRAKGLSDTITEKQDQDLTSAQEYDLVKYDGYTINGSTALNYAKVVVSKYEVPVWIKKGSGASETTEVISQTSDFTAMRDVTETTKYVNPLKEYICTVVRDANDAVDRIEIREK